MKQFLNFKKSDWPRFNEKIKEFIIEQEKEVDKSIIGLGQYSMRQEYEHFKVNSSKWFMLNADQKQSTLQKFHSASVEDKCSSLNLDISSPNFAAAHVHSSRVDKGSSVDMPTPTPDPSVNTTPSRHSNELSVGIEEAADITGLPILFLRQVWSKAAELLALYQHHVLQLRLGWLVAGP